VVVSWYSVHWSATVWFAVVQEPLAQLCDVSHMIRYCFPDSVIPQDHTVPVAAQGVERADVRKRVVGLLIGSLHVDRIGGLRRQLVQGVPGYPRDAQRRRSTRSAP
jgi:hypothetical protein